MVIFNKKEPFLLLVGDLVIFSASLWFSLAIRNGVFPSFEIYKDHFVPFSIVFLAWVLVFYISGLYDKYTTILKDKMPAMISNAQLANSVLAVIFFYFTPYFGITPKTILFINLIISFVLIYLWRINSHPLFGLKGKEPAIIVGSGEEMKSVEKEINNNPISGLNFVSSIDLDKAGGVGFVNEIVQKVYSDRISVIVIDLKDERVEPILQHLYNLIFAGVKFIDLDKIYENVFDRVPLSLLKYNWFLENVSLSRNIIFISLKRFSDILTSLILGVIFVVTFPFVALAIKIEDGSSIFYTQDRIGKKNRIIKISKYRSMSNIEKEKITKVGKFLRMTRVDELPQFWSILKGDLSLIGPRPEKPDLVALYDKEIPYYNIRHLIKPGLSGWAQICQDNPPKFEVNFDDTQTKLSYDLYYLKNKSVMLDIKIALKTIKTLISRGGK